MGLGGGGEKDADESARASWAAAGFNHLLMLRRLATLLRNYAAVASKHPTPPP